MKLRLAISLLLSLAGGSVARFSSTTGPEEARRISAGSSHPARPQPLNRHFMLTVPKYPRADLVQGRSSLTICRSIAPPDFEDPGDRYPHYYYSAQSDWNNAELLFKAIVMNGSRQAFLRLESCSDRIVTLKVWYPYLNTDRPAFDLHPRQSLALEVPKNAEWPRQNAPVLHFIGFKDEPSAHWGGNLPQWQQNQYHHQLSAASPEYRPRQPYNNVDDQLARSFHNIQLAPAGSHPTTYGSTSEFNEDDHLGFVHTPVTFEYIDSSPGARHD